MKVDSSTNAVVKSENRCNSPLRTLHTAETWITGETVFFCFVCVSHMQYISKIGYSTGFNCATG